MAGVDETTRQTKQTKQSSGSGSNGKVKVSIGRVRLRSGGNGSGASDGSGRRGRPRTPGQNPVALVRSSRQAKALASAANSSSNQASGIDSYMDDDFLREEARRKYRPEDFHVAVKNEHDHDETIHVRIHPTMKSAMEDMVRNGPFPFTSPQDVMRVGALELMKRLYRLWQTGEQETNWIAQLETISRVLFRNDQLLSFEGSLDTLRKTVERFRRQGKLGEKQAVRMVLDVRDAAKKLDKEWAEWYVQKIDDEYEEMIDRVTVPVRRVRRSS